MSELQTVQNENEKNLLSTQIEIQEKTFESISREIHDNIGQKLSIAKLHLNNIGKITNAVQNDKLLSAVKLISSSILDLGDISRTMNADFIKYQGLVKIIDLELQQLRKSSRYTVVFKVEGEEKFLSPQKELVAFRVVQEAINNIIKHAECNTISVVLSFEKTALELKIFDNGKGYEINMPGSSSGSGIHNMKKRTSYIGAMFNMESILTKGTSITLNIPYDKEN
jgi:signal transduction histidine kinase